MHEVYEVYDELLRHAFIRIGFLGAWRQIVPPERRREVFARLEANLNELASRQAELSVTIPMAYVQAEKSP
jgi:hypothetical protein